MRQTAEAPIPSSRYGDEAVGDPLTGRNWWGEVPAHWELLRLKNLASLRNERAEEISADTVYVGMENVESWTGRILLNSEPAAIEGTPTRFRAGDVLFRKLRRYLAKVARPGFQGVCTSELLVLRPGPKIEQTYLFYVLVCRDFIRWINSMTYGTRMPRVSPQEVLNSIIPLPPRTEQMVICEALDRETKRLEAAIGRMEAAVEKLREYRTALISRAVTGTIDVGETARTRGSRLHSDAPELGE